MPSMTHNSTIVPRTAPIPIAPKPPRPEPARYQESPRRFEIGSVGLHPRIATDPSSVSASAPASSQPLPPCRACVDARTKCIPSEDDDGCISCQVNATDCSLSSSTSSPGSRKRKLNGGISHEISGKRRSVSSAHAPRSLADSTTALRLPLTHHKVSHRTHPLTFPSPSPTTCPLPSTYAGSNLRGSIPLVTSCQSLTVLC